jgi:XTP/dITP diphosphohydrolase/tetrapyrrole methylase family protein/MazG family protein/ATP diphosphatase
VSAAEGGNLPPGGSPAGAAGDRTREEPAEALLELRRLTERLRRECPWDREQTTQSIVPHTVEESYEVADAALAGDDEKLLDELGDLLFQVYFLALLLEERDAGDLAQVARGVHEKLVRRHPHVFADTKAGSVGGEAADARPEDRDASGIAGALTADRVRSNWERIKREQEGREGIFHDVAEGLPGLLYARKIQLRAKAVGFEYPDLAGAMADLADELRELEEEPSGDELGDLLFAAVNVARRLEVDPELEVRRASQRFRRRVEVAEELAAKAGENWSELPLERQDQWYDKAKEKA